MLYIGTTLDIYEVNEALALLESLQLTVNISEVQFIDGRVIINESAQKQEIKVNIPEKKDNFQNLFSKTTLNQQDIDLISKNIES